MPSGGQRKGAGRPPAASHQLRSMQRLHSEIIKDKAAFERSLQHGFLAGVAKMAEAFPGVINRLVDRAISDGDIDAQKFIAEKFVRFFHPDLVLQSDSASPLTEYIKRLHAAVESANDELAPQHDGQVVVALVGDAVSEPS